jgi:hypothetical protein
MKTPAWLTPFLASLALLSPLATADEGMWLFSAFPKAEIQKRYGVTVSDELLNHIQFSAVRFNSGGTGSFVSPNGLLFTNHHVGADCIQKVSSAGNDFIKNGFLANTQAEERGCPDLEVNVLTGIEDVTAKVKAAEAGSADPIEANRLRKAGMSAIEKACTDSTGSRCDLVTLFSGAQYHLYKYKKYTDIRLVFAPEFDIAFFGGDPENFTYPRYNLDVTFFRAYENGQPAKVDHYFKWSRTGVKEGELVLVPGNPGSTGRLQTVTELEFQRDLSFPLTLRRIASLVSTLQAYMKQGPEQFRIGNDNLFGQQNSFKAISGFDRGLKDPKLMGKKRAAEKDLRARIAANDAQREKFGKLWDELSTAYATFGTYYPRYALLESGATRGSTLLALARGIVRYSTQTRLPAADRLREYVETALPAREQAMYSPAPITPGMEIAVLADYFAFLSKELGAADPIVTRILDGKTPAQAAELYVNSSKIIDVAERKRLASDPAAVKASTDGMIRLALILDAPALELRKRYEDQVESVVTRAAAQIAQARFDLSGGAEYPDATFTLRVAFGPVKGYKNAQGRNVPWATTLSGLWPKATGKDPYVIPPTWLKAKAKLNPNTAFNFVSTADTHGGNSGSATLNAKGEVVGILFDGNIEGLPNRFVYTDEQARSVHVASQSVTEALKFIYSASNLLKELGLD